MPFIIGYIIWFKFDNLKKALKTPQFWIGDGGTILHTTTAGNVWMQADTKSKHKFEKIVFNGNKGWIVSFGGTILSYEAGKQALTERPILRIR